MLTSGDKYIVRIMLRNRIYSSDGSAFETLFSDIMSKYNPEFEQVKPYGNVGDRKNDGFDKTVGEYYQVFAPESLEKQTTIGEAVKKLDEDFEGLYKHWNALCPIKKYNFVINDKYKGAPQPLHQKMLEISKAYPEITFNIMTVNKLEDYFLSLAEDDMITIVGCIADPALQLDYSALTEVLNHLMNIKGNIERTDLRNVEEKLPDWTFTLFFSHNGKEHKISRNTSKQSDVYIDGQKLKLSDARKFMENIAVNDNTISFRNLLSSVLRRYRDSYTKYDRCMNYQDDYQCLLQIGFLLGLDIDLITQKHTLRVEQDKLKKTEKAFLSKEEKCSSNRKQLW